MEPAQIKNLRASLGYTQAEFGQLFGKKVRAVAYWEAGQRSPSKADMYAMEVLHRYVGDWPDVERLAASAESAMQFLRDTGADVPEPDFSA